MAKLPIPALTKQAPTIDFIDGRLSKYHPVFSSRSVKYDQMSRHYVPASQALVANTNNSLATPPASNAPPGSNGLPQRPEWTDTNAMKFWNEVFPDAMIRFKSTKEPKGRSKTVYHIRDKPNWDTIYETLELARSEYQRSGGPVGWIRKVRRKVADNITPGAEATKIASKLVPQDPIATPVVGAVEVVLDAVKTAATVRNQVLAGFDGVVPIFSDVEVFLSTFQGDVNIRNASIDLIAATLEAVERAIGFFISNEFFRGGKALLSGGDYEESLLESLTMIQTKARDLIQQALKSHIFQFHMYSQETRRVLEQLTNKVDILVTGNNKIEQLLRDHLQQKDRELEVARQENIYLKVENGILRSTSPIQQSMWAPPPQSAQAPALGWYISQDTLRNMIDTFDLDFADIAFVMDKKEQLSGKDKARAEQIIHTQLFQNWIVSASSSKLLVHWDLHRPKKIAEVSPLSVFCMTLVQSLRTKDRFMSALWFCGRHVDESDPGARTGGRAMLLSLIDQLLRQFEFDTRPLHNHIDLVSLQEGGLEVLIKLLHSLVRQLPPQTTLFIIVDGAVLFERDQFEAEALRVFASLIILVADTSVMASIKVLFTSTPGTHIVRGAFEPEDLILSVDNLPRPAIGSEERMVRELKGELGDDGDGDEWS
ncbi:hypothetical protein GGP41_000358 [Bipolaris sorokiniana]|uniref:Uncharacterized protein n=2 Tax=Cochliobolus sativus TaxID=45130 RepID=A0A8H6DV52_COCSA|nr:hypothetical protein GGP41_000358 [Bipolaris sorokiniana]